MWRGSYISRREYRFYVTFHHGYENYLYTVEFIIEFMYIFYHLVILLYYYKNLIEWKLNIESDRKRFVEK